MLTEPEWDPPYFEPDGLLDDADEQPEEDREAGPGEQAEEHAYPCPSCGGNGCPSCAGTGERTSGPVHDYAAGDCDAIEARLVFPLLSRSCPVCND